MRFMIKASLSTEAANATIKNGTLPTIIQSIMEEQKPEAAYFMVDNGTRTAYVFVDIQETSEIPKMAEPWWLAFNAHVEIHPAMTAEDLGKAGPDIHAAVEKYG